MTAAEAGRAGAEAFARGESRAVPLSILAPGPVGACVPLGRAWLAGWDRANLAAPWE